MTGKNNPTGLWQATIKQAHLSIPYASIHNDTFTVAKGLHVSRIVKDAKERGDKLAREHHHTRSSSSAIVDVDLLSKAACLRLTSGLYSCHPSPCRLSPCRDSPLACTLITHHVVETCLCLVLLSPTPDSSPNHTLTHRRRHHLRSHQSDSHQLLLHRPLPHSHLPLLRKTIKPLP